MIKEKEKQLQIDIAKANEELLRDISVKKLIWLSENFRNGQCEYIYIDGCDKRLYERNYGRNYRQGFNVSRRRFRYLTDSQYWATLKLGTFAGNGYYRQKCMERLQNAEGSLPFLILRMNDWVVPIRESAWQLSQKRMRKCGLYELFWSLPMLEKVKNSTRRKGAYISSLEAQAESLIRQKLQSAPEGTLDEIHRYEIQIKNAVYRFINCYPVLKREQMERLLVQERTGYGQTLLILAIFRHYGYDSIAAEKYLHAKSAVVRYHTLVYRYEQERDVWNGLQEMLLDESRRVRDYAGYILEKHTDMDITAFYLQELERNATKTVLSGIGEHGTKKEAEVLKPFLNEERAPMCKAALNAYGKLLQEEGAEIYWGYLSDTRPVMARQAYRCVRKYGISYGAPRLYEAYLQNRSDFMSDCFLTLLLGEPFWTRLPFLLRLYGQEALPENQRRMIKEGICCKRHMLYDSVSGQQAEVIRGLLEQNREKLPEAVCKEILFDLKYVTRE